MAYEERFDILVRFRSLAGRQLAALNKGFTSLGKTAGGVGKVLTSLQAHLTGLLTGAALVAFSKNAIDVFSKFDDTLRAAGAVMGATQDEFVKLGKAAEDMGRKTKFSAAQSADGLRLLGMAGFDVQESIEALPGVLNLAAAGSLDLADAADIATNVVAGFNLEVKDLGSVNDVLAKTFTSSNSTLQELGEAFKLVGPIAAGVGADFEDLVGALGKLHDAGLKGTIAGTSLRGAMSALLNPTNQEAKLMAELGARIGQTTINVRDSNGQFLGFAEIVRQLEEAGLDGAEALKLFGDRAGPGMQALLSVGSEELRNYTEELKNAGGTTDEISARMEAGVGGASRRMAAAFEGIKIAIGKAFEDRIIRQIDKTTELFNKLIDTIIRLDADGTLDTWAQTATESIKAVAWVVRKLGQLFLWVGKTISVVALEITGNFDAAQMASEDSLDSLYALFDKVRDTSPEIAFYKINKATGEVAETTVLTTNKVRELAQEYAKLSEEGQADIAGLKAAEAKLGSGPRSGPIGRGKNEGKVQTQKTEVVLEPTAGAVLKADVQKVQSIIKKEMTGLEIMYDQGVIQLKEYFDTREALTKEAVAKEIKLLQAAAAAEDDPDKRLAINAKIFKQKQELEASLLQLTADRLKEEERLEKQAATNKEAIARVFADVKARVDAGDQGALEAQRQREIADLQERQNKELDILRQGEATKAEEKELVRLQELEKMQLFEDQARLLMQYRLDTASDIAKGVGDLFSEMYDLSGKKQKEFFYLMKAARVAEATINIANAVIGALGSPPYGYGAIATSAVIAGLGAVQIAKIISTGMASGGEVPGSSPTKTSDNIVARLTAGEFVHPVDSVKYYGTNIMEAIRRRAIPKTLFEGFGIPSPQIPKRSFATGGPAIPSKTEIEEGSQQGNVINNFIDPALFSQHMSTSTGQRDVWNVLTNNPYKLKQLVFAQ